jgi:hypothetical protein
MSERQFSEVPEFSRHETTTRRREIAAAGASAHQHLDVIKQRLKAPNLTAIETEIQPAAVIGCPDQFRVTGLTDRTKPTHQETSLRAMVRRGKLHQGQLHA